VPPLPQYIREWLAPAQPKQFFPPPQPKAISSYWAGIALEREIDAMASAPEGQRNNQLNRSAYNLGQLVGDNLISRADVENALLFCAGNAGLGKNEAQATIKSGLDAGIRNPRSNRVRK
jgi:hypothetical protein